MAEKSSRPETVIASALAAVALVRSAGSLGGGDREATAQARRDRRERLGRTGVNPNDPGRDPRDTIVDDRRRAAQPGRGRQAKSPTDIPAQGWKDIALRVKTEIKDDNVPLLSAGVAFYSMLALFPALVAVVSIYGLVADPTEVATQLRSLTKAMPQQAAKLIVDQVQSIAGSSSGALGITVVIGIVTALWSASSGMKWLMSALSLVYDEKEDRKFIKLRGTALLLTVGAAVGLVISIGLITAVPALSRAIGLGSTGALVIGIIKWPLLFTLVVVGLATLYHFGPNRDFARWSWVSVGSAIGAVIWLAASAGFAIYSAVAGSFSDSYGSFAAIVVLMLWLYLSVLAVMIGAEINAEMEHQTGRDTTRDRPEPLGSRGATMADQVAAAPTD